MKILADTSALLALAVEKDRHHERAVEFRRSNPHVRLVLTELVLAEFGTRYRARRDASTTAAAIRDYLRSAAYEVVFIERELLSAGADLMAKFSDKRLSLTDCVSFALMDRLRLRQAFTFDHDFRDCGYEMVP